MMQSFTLVVLACIFFGFLTTRSSWAYDPCQRSFSLGAESNSDSYSSDEHYGDDDSSHMSDDDTNEASSESSDDGFVGQQPLEDGSLIQMMMRLQGGISRSVTPRFLSSLLTQPLIWHLFMGKIFAADTIIENLHWSRNPCFLLHFACETRAFHDMIPMLINRWRNEANINAQSGLHEKTALTYFIESFPKGGIVSDRDADHLLLLLEKGAELSNRDMTLSYVVSGWRLSLEKSKEILQYDRTNIDVPVDHHVRPLCYAILNMNSFAVKALLDSGASVQAPCDPSNRQSPTPLKLAEDLFHRCADNFCKDQMTLITSALEEIN